MKLTKRQLKRIIKEERQKILSESEEYQTGLADGQEDRAAEESGGAVYGPEKSDEEYMRGYEEGFEGSLSEAVGRRGPVPRQGLQPDDQLIVDEIIELILDRDPDIGTRERALRQLKYYINNMK